VYGESGESPIWLMPIENIPMAFGLVILS